MYIMHKTKLNIRRTTCVKVKALKAHNTPIFNIAPQPTNMTIEEIDYHLSISDSMSQLNHRKEYLEINNISYDKVEEYYETIVILNNLFYNSEKHTNKLVFNFSLKYIFNFIIFYFYL